MFNYLIKTNNMIFDKERVQYNQDRLHDFFTPAMAGIRAAAAGQDQGSSLVVLPMTRETGNFTMRGVK